MAELGDRCGLRTVRIRLPNVTVLRQAAVCLSGSPAVASDCTSLQSNKKRVGEQGEPQHRSRVSYSPIYHCLHTKKCDQSTISLAILVSSLSSSPPSSLLVSSHPSPHPTHLGSSNLRLQDLLQRHGISGELADALAQLLHGHLLLVELEAEQRLIVDVAPLLDVELARLLRLELPWDRVGRVGQDLEEVWL